ncbi:MAG TPA: hypothetical protein VLD59_08210 [Steroidobacteraceae bacterium]|nr:hypothetical protein [Steroidobacteraceae bacterium]
MSFKRAAPARRDRSGEFDSLVLERPRARMAQRIDLQHADPIVKEDYFHSEAWRRAVASLPCVLCNKHGETQCAHRNEGKAGGKRLMDDCWTAALCVACHAEIDQGCHSKRAERRERMDLAILLTLRQLARIGLVGAKK